MTALDFIFHLGVIPMSIERKEEVASRSEVRRWLNQQSVVINGKKPRAMDEIDMPVEQLVFFPKSQKRRTTVI